MTVVDKEKEKGSLFPLRTVVVLIAALLCGAAIGGLAYLAGDNVPTALIAGLLSASAALGFWHVHIDRD